MPVCLLLVFALFPLLQEHGARAQNTAFLNHQAWSTEEGLPQASVHQILQSRDGYLWLATEGGVARFDAVGFRNYTHENTPVLTSNDVSSLAEAPAGVLWFGTSDGLIRSDGRSMRRFTESDGLPSSSIVSLAAGKGGELFILTTAGVALHDGSGFHTPNAALAEITSMERSADDTVWMFGGPDPLRYDAGALVPVPEANLAGERVLGVLAGPGGARWMWSSRTILLTLGSLHRVFRAGKDLTASRMQALLVDRNGTAWIGTNRGVFTIAAQPSSSVAKIPALQSDSILSLFQDREANVWIGTEGSGLHALRPRKFQADSASAGERVTTVAESSDGIVWYGTRGDGLRCLRRGIEEVPVPAAALTSPVILSLAPGIHGDMWAGTPDGLNHVEHGSVHRYTSANGLPDDFIRSLLVSHDGSVWLGTRSGLAHLQGNRITSVTGAQGLASNSVGPLLEGKAISSGSQAQQQPLWVGTAAGLTLVRDTGPQNFSPRKDGLPGDIVTAIAQDPQGDLWVGVLNAGLSRFMNGRFQTIKAPGLPVEMEGMSIDAAGYLWIRGKRGVYRASLQALKQCAATKETCTGAVAQYGVADGMPSEELTADGTPTMWHTAAGDLWFATRKGLAVARPSYLPVNPVPPPVLMQRFTVDDVEQPLTASPLRIGSGHRSFTFDYAALSYTMPSRVRYRYKLEGFDRDWIDAGARRTAYYTSLPGRRYQFRVIAENNDGVWNDAGADLRFSISPAFYLRWWFYALLFVLLSAAIALAIQIRLRTVRTQFALVLNERNRVAREIHDTLAQDLVSLSLQIELVSQSVRDNRLAQASVQLQEARSFVKKGLEEARQSIWNLRANVTRNSLPTRLSQAVEQFARTHPATRITIGGAYRKLRERTEDEVVRIAQESLSNIERHAAATEVFLDLRYESTTLALTVRDNGRGFRYADLSSMAGHYGVRGMEERAAALGASLTMASNPGEGTTVTLIVPLRPGEGPQT